MFLQNIKMIKHDVLNGEIIPIAKQSKDRCSIFHKKYSFKSVFHDENIVDWNIFFLKE